MKAPHAATWLLTGVTGFLGKVLLEELLRNRSALGLARVMLLIRPRGTARAHERFASEVAASPCFAGLTHGWTDFVDVIEGDLRHPTLALADADRARLQSVTHVVHSAASVSFDLPAREAAAANVHASLHLLEAVRELPLLERFVYVSTAYVTPHPGAAPILEELVPLPVPASTLLAAIDAGVSSASVLVRTGHPNTYTLTKCIAEHLLSERAGALPLSIVRPSIISASRATPHPGWIDSTAGFGGFVLQIGLGYLRAVIGNPSAQLDLIPVDEVARRVVIAARTDLAPRCVRHAVAGLTGAPRVDESWARVDAWFRRHPAARRPLRGYLGTSPAAFRLADWWHHRLPLALHGLRGAEPRRRSRRLAQRLDYLNAVFPYFTSRSFDFRSSLPLPERHAGPAYIGTICRGVSEHLLRRDRSEWVVAGAARRPLESDLRWAWRQPHGNQWIRAASWLVTKFLRRTTDCVTVDLPSFERARAQIREDDSLVLVPSHRSYLDFILCSYLAFARPDLGIPIPHIAATMEFGRIPMLGRLLTSLHAFYLQRGRGRADPELTRRVHELVARGHTLEFFVEGARSRTREFLPPKRGLLRCLQSTGRPIALLPIAISYDRLPEEAAIAVELAGGARPPMELRALIAWAWRAWRGRVSLGRIHIVAGAPITLDHASDVAASAEAIINELRRAMPVTSYQIRAYLASHPVPGHTADSIARMLALRGKRVLQSSLAVDPTQDARVAATFGAHFLWALSDDALANLPRAG